MAGYSGTPLVKKLGIKENFRVAFVNPPTGFQKELGSLPVGVDISVARLAKPLDLIILFTYSQRTLKTEFPKLAQKLTPMGCYGSPGRRKRLVSQPTSQKMTFDKLDLTPDSLM